MQGPTAGNYEYGNIPPVSKEGEKSSEFLSN